MPPSESTMPLCDLLAQVRSYWLGQERRVEEDCEKQGLESALSDRDVRPVPRWLLMIHRRGIIGRHELAVLHLETHVLLVQHFNTAKETYQEEQFKRSGKSFTDFMQTPYVWDFCRQELIKVVLKPLTENELDDYVARVAFRAIESTCQTSVELARLDQQGFTTKLLAKIRTDYPNDAKAMKLPLAVEADKPKRSKTRTMRRPRKEPTEKQRDTWLLRQKNLPFREIGERLGICESAARKRFKNAERLIRDKSRSVQARQSIPSDRRGQEDVEAKGR